MKRDAYEFRPATSIEIRVSSRNQDRRDIVVGAENPRTGKTIAEKVLKYMEDKLTQKERRRESVAFTGGHANQQALDEESGL